MIRLKKKPSFKKTLRHFDRMQRLRVKHILNDYGRKGVQALARATPVDTGEASQSWSYKVEGDQKRSTITWYNSAMAGSVPLVIILQYGHATKSGYFLSGRDFINPALKPIYDGLHARLKKEVFK